MKLFMSLSVIASLAVLAVAAPIPKDKEKLAPPTEKQLEASRDNLKMMGIAMHNYHDTVGIMPADVVDKDGKPTLSWRVHLLPYVEEEALYKLFKLDEPWDSKHNKALIEKIPKVYAPLRVKAERGYTFYRGFNGAGAAFETGQKIRIPASFPDGTSNTILVVEAGEACIWTKPDDLPYDPEKPLPKLGGLFDGDFHVVLADSSVQRGFGKTMIADQFRRMITRNDGFVVGAGALGEKKK